MSNESIIILVAACSAVFAFAAWVGLLAIPAWQSYSRVWERLGAVMAEAIVLHYGRDELLRAHPGVAEAGGAGNQPSRTARGIVSPNPDTPYRVSSCAIIARSANAQHTNGPR